MRVPTQRTTRYEAIGAEDLGEKIANDLNHLMAASDVTKFSANYDGEHLIGRVKAVYNSGAVEHTVYLAGAVGDSFLAHKQSGGSKERRNGLILALGGANLRQEEIADVMEVSQALVSKVIRSAPEASKRKKS